MDRSHEIEKLVAAIRQLAPAIVPSTDEAWKQSPALCVIDCVLSLNRNYDKFVVPRLEEFCRKWPQLESFTQLQTLIKKYTSAHEFTKRELRYNDETRSEVLTSVVDWVVEICGRGDIGEQRRHAEEWAKNSSFGESSPNIKNFGLSGFQYLRMLFGANTTKPDVHICRFVAKILGRKVSDYQALDLLEQAATEASVSIRDLDTTIWEASARRDSAKPGRIAKRNPPPRCRVINP